MEIKHHFTLRVLILLLDQEGMVIELLSFSDNKEGVAKAASFLCSKYLKSNPAVSDRVEPVFTEADMDDALMAVGMYLF